MHTRSLVNSHSPTLHCFSVLSSVLSGILVNVFLLTRREVSEGMDYYTDIDTESELIAANQVSQKQ